jgi:glycosyl transferase family 2
MPPRFSIVLPTRNRAGLLRLAIASVLAQTERDFELFVVGDDCTDNTAEVVASFDDPRIRWLDLPKAAGFGYANRNIALAQAAGEFIAYVTDDDLVFPDHLALLAEALERAGAEWVYGRPLWVTTEGLVLPFAVDLRNPDELDVFLTVCNTIPSTCVLHRRSCLERYGYWPEDVRSAGDWKYWIRIIEGGQRANFGYCPTPSALHFNANWKTTPETQHPLVIAARDIAVMASWWPTTLNVPIAHGKAQQEIFVELIGRDDYVQAIRRDVARVIEKLAWMRLTEAPETVARLREEADQARAEHAQARTQLAAVDTELATLHQLVSTQGDELAEAREELADKVAQLHETKVVVDALHASTSWRLTAPLRVLRRMMSPKPTDT